MNGPLPCPLCGDALKWSCGPTDGEAYCSALQSRVLVMHDGRPYDPKQFCEFTGKVRRVSPSQVELVPVLDHPQSQ